MTQSARCLGYLRIYLLWSATFQTLALDDDDDDDDDDNDDDGDDDRPTTTINDDEDDALAMVSYELQRQ